MQNHLINYASYTSLLASYAGVLLARVLHHVIWSHLTRGKTSARRTSKYEAARHVCTALRFRRFSIRACISLSRVPFIKQRFIGNIRVPRVTKDPYKWRKTDRKACKEEQLSSFESRISSCSTNRSDRLVYNYKPVLFIKDLNSNFCLSLEQIPNGVRCSYDGGLSGLFSVYELVRRGRPSTSGEQQRNSNQKQMGSIEWTVYVDTSNCGCHLTFLTSCLCSVKTLAHS